MSCMVSGDGPVPEEHGDSALIAFGGGLDHGLDLNGRSGPGVLGKGGSPMDSSTSCKFVTFKPPDVGLAGMAHTKGKVDGARC